MQALEVNMELTSFFQIVFYILLIICEITEIPVVDIMQLSKDHLKYWKVLNSCGWKGRLWWVNLGWLIDAHPADFSLPFLTGPWQGV